MFQGDHYGKKRKAGYYRQRQGLRKSRSEFRKGIYGNARPKNRWLRKRCDAPHPSHQKQETLQPKL